MDCISLNHNLQVSFPKEAKLPIDKSPYKIPKLLGWTKKKVF